MRRWVLVFVTMFLTAGLYAQGITATLVAPLEMPPGAHVEVNLVLLNPGTEATRAALPMELHAHLVGEGRVWQIPIVIKTTPVPVISAGSFSQATCSFVVPEDAAGRLVLEIEDPLVRAVVDVKRPEGQEPMADSGRTVPAPLTNSGRVPALAQFHRVFSENISTHLPIYFIFGPKKPAAKFQFSFKYRIFGDRSTAGTLNPPLSGLYFGYTQRSVWDITSYSSPFYDTSYMPELMFESLTAGPAKPGFLGIKWYGYQASLQHESNGRDGNSSRSLNLFYVRPMIGRDFGDKWMLMFTPKLFVYVDNLSDNPDLPRYRGYGEYLMTLGRKNSWSLSALGRIGSHFDRGSIQLDFSYPLRITYGNFASYLLVQYFDGYGESLVGYKERSRVVRAGFSLVR